MWRRRVSAAVVTTMIATSACSYATMPRIDELGPRGPGARAGRPCTTSRLAPRFDTLWVGIGGLMVGEAGLFAAAAMFGPDGGPSPLSAEDTYEMAIVAGGMGAVLLHYAVKSRRHGYRMAEQCEDARHVEPAYCVVDQIDGVWRTTIVARNDGPLTNTYAVVAYIADSASPPRELVQIVTLAPDQRREIATFAARAPVASCTVELRPVALFHDR
jgi:hypothetical protein